MKYLSSPKKIAAEMRTLNLKDRNSLISILLYVVTILSLVYPVLLPKKAHAAVTESFVRFDRHSTGAAISGSACLETTTVGTETNVVLVFPNDWTISSTASNWTVTTTNLPTAADGTAATAWPGINTASSVDGASVVFPGSDLSNAGQFYCFNFTGASSTIGAAGNNKVGQLKTQGGSPFVDTVNWATSVVASNTDQITVTASVAAQMTFSLNANSVSLGTLASGSTTAGSAVTQSVSTNARNGWISWVKSGTNGGSNAGALHSTIANSDIVSPGSFDGAPETLSSTGGYVLDVNLNSCGGCTIGAEYNGTTADEGGFLSYNIFRQTAHYTAPASANTVDLVVKARSAATTPAAADYTDTLTVVAAGSF